MIPYSIAPARVACAINQVNNLHVLFTDKTGTLWHTVRYATAEQSPFQYPSTQQWLDYAHNVLEVTNAKGAHIDGVVKVACAIDIYKANLLHVCVVDGNGKLWHTIRDETGSWNEDGFRGVQEAFGWHPGGHSPISAGLPDVGGVAEVACATNARGDLHMCVINTAGRIYHTIRMFDGSWPSGFGDVLQIVGVNGKSNFNSPIDGIACSCSDRLSKKLIPVLKGVDPAPAMEDDLHVAIISEQTAWHTVRSFDTTWPHDWTNIAPSQSLGESSGLATAVNRASGELHLILANPNGLLHTIAVPNSSPTSTEAWAWSSPLGNASNQTKPPLSAMPDYPACATNLLGDLHVTVACDDFSLKHTARLADKSWYNLVTVSQHYPPPTVTLNYVGTKYLPAGTDSTSLTWTSQFAAQLSIDQGIGSVKVPSGTRKITPQRPTAGQITITYTITAVGLDGSTASDTQQILVDALSSQSQPTGGVKGISLQNCNDDKRSVNIWVQDHSTGNWQDMGVFSSQWDNGNCPDPSSPNFVVNFQDKHIYSVVAVDPELCGGANDPTLLNCQRWSGQFIGDVNGIIFIQQIH